GGENSLILDQTVRLVDVQAQRLGFVLRDSCGETAPAGRSKLFFDG
ncbi:MAG: hypothetical protein ACI9DE_002251, partial [Halioglobus sp.]